MRADPLHLMASMKPSEAALQIGPYKVVRPLAVGGMAEILLAEEVRGTGLRRKVILKRILPSHAHQPELVAMLKDEAAITSRLSHPNVVEIYESPEGADFIAMEFIDGRSLHEIASRLVERRERFPIRLALWILIRACSALEHAHDRRDDRGRPLEIVHRDLSPHNVLVGFDGTVKLIDFGIAKARDKASVTDIRMIKGKYCYLSPEQVLQHPIDRRADLFTLGISMYEILTGERPFLRNSLLETLNAIVREAPIDCRERCPELNDATAAILRRALEKDRAKRWQTAGDLRDALVRCLASMEPVTTLEIQRWIRELFCDLWREVVAGGFAENTVVEPASGFEDVDTELDLEAFGAALEPTGATADKRDRELEAPKATTVEDLFTPDVLELEAPAPLDHAAFEESGESGRPPSTRPQSIRGAIVRGIAIGAAAFAIATVIESLASQDESGAGLSTPVAAPVVPATAKVGAKPAPPHEVPRRTHGEAPRGRSRARHAPPANARSSRGAR
jgi:eukaryotic-like serine/threonine-protein kinase